MGRGGYRSGAGRKSGWRNAETQTIRVPKVFVDQVLAYTRYLDSGTESSESGGADNSDFDAESKSAADENQFSLFDVDHFTTHAPSPLIDLVTHSEPVPLQGIELAKRLGVNRGIPSNMKKRRSPQKFIEWSRSKDPGGIGWLWNERLKMFEPILDSHLHDDF